MPDLFDDVVGTGLHRDRLAFIMHMHGRPLDKPAVSMQKRIGDWWIRWSLILN
jgi:hypothetical protein